MIRTTSAIWRIVVVVDLAFGGVVQARGVSPYLPLQQSPEIERKIERLLILADQPVLTRPIAAATVLDALPAACERDAALCAEVRRYLAGYMRTAGLGHASLAASDSSGTAVPLPNRHGMSSHSGYEFSGGAYWQPSDHLLLSGGIVAYDGSTTPTGTVVSFGNEYAQMDVGYRDHWLSPMTDGAMLLSTEASTMPSVTLSNFTPMGRLKFRYEAFAAQMSESSNIVYEDRLTTGHPQLAGVHLSIEPFPGWAIGVNRVMQYGGGERQESFGDLLRAFFDPSSDNTIGEFGNQAASFTSRFISSGRLPLAVYFEYAGEDTSTTNNARLGNVALSAGIDLPRLSDRLAMTFEITEWQNGWYVHHIYLDGLTNEGRVIGQWGADWREPADEVGARSWMLRLDWALDDGAGIQATYRSLENQQYGRSSYSRASALDVRYSRPWRDFHFGGELNAGHDSFGESFARLGAFIRF